MHASSRRGSSARGQVLGGTVDRSLRAIGARVVGVSIALGSRVAVVVHRWIACLPHGNVLERHAGLKMEVAGHWLDEDQAGVEGVDDLGRFA